MNLMFKWLFIGVDRDAQHNISLSEISGAVSGAITYVTAGEISPRLTLENNRIINNCRQLYGNFSTCEAAIKLDVQNMQTFHFQVTLPSTSFNVSDELEK